MEEEEVVETLEELVVVVAADMEEVSLLDLSVFTTFIVVIAKLLLTTRWHVTSTVDGHVPLSKAVL